MMMVRIAAASGAILRGSASIESASFCEARVERAENLASLPKWLMASASPCALVASPTPCLCRCWEPSGPRSSPSEHRPGALPVQHRAVAAGCGQADNGALTDPHDDGTDALAGTVDGRPAERRGPVAGV